MTQLVGTSYAVTVPTLADQASILDAFKYYHQGQLTGSPATNSIEQHLININTRAGAIETAIGYPYVGGISISTRLGSLETAVGSSIQSTYLKMIPSSNSVLSGQNLVAVSDPVIIPMTIRGANSQTADLQQWQVYGGAVRAKIDKDGKLYSYDGSSMVDVVTTTGTQTITNKTINAPFTTVATNAKTTSYTLVLSDQSKIVEINNVGATTLTIPTDASVAFPVGTYILVMQTGAGQVTIAPFDGSVTVNSTPGLKLRAQWSSATLFKRAANLWVVMGDTVA